MIYITKLELENFQSHKKSTLEFNRGLNVIIGSSDSGKTAIIRAIKWALYNEPQGDYFIRQGEKKVSVTIYFNTGAIVRRFRSSSKNSYYLKKSNGEEFNFDGFGRSVPKEIIQEINMYKISLDSSNDNIINIAEQLEGPFLINEKTSIRASAIGRLIGVNLIDNAMRDAIRDSKTSSTSLKYLKSKSDELSEELKAFYYLKDKELLLGKLKALKKDLDTKIIFYDKLNDLNKFYLNFNSELKVIKKELNKYKNLEKISILLSDINFKYYKYKELKNLSKNYIDISLEISYNTKILEKVKNLSKLENLKENIIFKFDKYKNFNDLYKNLEILNVNLENTRFSLNKYKDLTSIDNLQISLKEKIKKYNNILDIYSRYTNIIDRIELGEKFIKKYKQIDKVLFISKNLNDKISLLNLLSNSLKSLNALTEDIKNLNNYINKTKISIDEYYNEYEYNLLKLGHCPLCMSEITDDTISHIKELL
ncbi:AAA family ATPase [Peptoniphilus catoniae]|uniref:AAA family ATPase n=1 Tax=Peptoniphilus catoniae TaxID=1660341 RepID=UPI0015D62F66|nr:AAA family ATPase [Peptoniphilus catoniae]